MAGFNSAVSILRDFNLPIVDKSGGSPRKADPMIDGSSVSSYIPYGNTTAMSRLSDNGRTVSTALSWHDRARSIASGNNQSRQNTTQNLGTNFGSLLPRQPSNMIVRPGPSLLESIVHVNRQDEYPPEQIRYMDTSQSRNFGLRPSSQARDGSTRQSEFNGRAIDFDNEIVSPVRRFDLSVRAPTPSWISRIPTVNYDAPPSGQKRMLRTSQELSQDFKTDQIDTTSNGGWGLDQALNTEGQAISNQHENPASARLAVRNKSVAPSRTKSTQSILPKKVAAMKRGSKRIFKSVAAQTEDKSVSRATQTEPVTVISIDDGGPGLNKLQSMIGQRNTISESTRASINQNDKKAVIWGTVTASTQTLRRRKEPRINKFVRRESTGNLPPAQNVNSESTSSEIRKSLHAPPTIQTHTRRRGGNKFTRQNSSLHS